MTAEELSLGARIRALITGVLGSATWEGGGGAGSPATAILSGTVRTDVTDPGPDPVVYLKGSSDTLLTGKAAAVHTHAGTDIISGLVAAARLAAHDIISAHSAAGLTIGNVIRAATATTFAFAALATADLSDFNTAGDARWAPVVHTHTFASLTAKPTTLAGYGITDAAPLVHTHAAADVISGRFVAARMLDGTNGFIFFGKGSGVNPAYASFVTVRLTADNAAIAAAVPTTALQVALLTQDALINEEWDLEWIIEIANSVAADVFVFNVTSTAGTLTGRYTVEGTSGVPNTGAGVVKFWSMPVGTITVANANAPGATGTIGLVFTVIVRARVKLTVANATIQLLLRAGTNAALTSGTATVKSGSQLIANKIA